MLTRGDLEGCLATLLAAHATIKIATIGESPWIIAAYFAQDGLYSLRTMLEGGGRTMANIRANPRVAIMIENGDALAMFAQADGRAYLIDDAAAEFQSALVAKTPASEPLVRLPNLVPVAIGIDRWRLTDVKAGWLPAKELLPAPAG
jgi:hypothetical protein